MLRDPGDGAQRRCEVAKCEDLENKGIRLKMEQKKLLHGNISDYLYLAQY